MQYDWNSFFGTFCQISGAFIGIIAAFLTARLLGLHEKSNSLNDQYENLSLRFSNLIFSLDQRFFAWLIRKQIEESTYIRNKIKCKSYKNCSDEEILIDIYDHVIDYDNDELVLEVFKKMCDNYTETPNFLSTAISVSITQKIEDEQERIKSLEIQSYSLITEFVKTKQAMVSFGNELKPMKFLITVLLFAFPILVVYPLHFLPLPFNVKPNISLNPFAVFQFLFSIRGIFLIIFFFLFEGIFIYFLSMIRNIHIKNNALLARFHKDYFDIKKYSPFFRQQSLDTLARDLENADTTNPPLF